MNRKKTKTTYGVYNLIEWQAILRMGKATVKVPFTGGSITTQGITPATYTTEDPIVQFAIERSPEYLNGKIKVIRRVNTGGVVEIERNPARPMPVPEVVKIQEKAGLPVEENTGSQEEDRPVTTLKKDSVAEEALAEEAEHTEAPHNVRKTLTQVEFSNNDDAKDYLETSFGVTRSKLRNREIIKATGEAYGVEIIFVDND